MSSELTGALVSICLNSSRIVFTSSKGTRYLRNTRHEQMCGGVLKREYPQIIHLNRSFHHKPSSYWGAPILGNLGNLYIYVWLYHPKNNIIYYIHIICIVYTQSDMK